VRLPRLRRSPRLRLRGRPPQRDSPLHELWRDPGTFGQLRGKTADQLEGGCHTCPMAATCLAGRTAMAVSSTGLLYDNRHCLRRLETAGVLAALAPD